MPSKFNIPALDKKVDDIVVRLGLVSESINE
jgi:hypothetical protein